ncbi:MAG: hypothetical protein EOM50_09215 [Erysipelotrichia bacterium]|nr:hypothetical protein [Erysipelotrichia bacterium]NCC54645.1 hypothetical protein [Erysipelotrichia bacterium]
MIKKEQIKSQKRFLYWTKENRRSSFIVLMVVLFFALLLFMLSVFYSKSLQTMVNENSYSYLKEISEQINTNLIKELDYHYSTLKTMIRKVSQNEGWGVDAIIEDLEVEAENYGYDALVLIQDDGILRSSKKA